MKRIALVGMVSTLWLAHGAFAQSSAKEPPPPTSTQVTQPASAPPKAPSATPDSTGAPKTSSGKTEEKRKAYTGNTGKKKDAGTACSSARPSANGGVDCGTSGNAATTGSPPK
jgi:hypothetical protein